MKERVLVTGASGYIAGNVILELIRQGYQVRGTLRSLGRAGQVLGWLERAHGAPLGDSLAFVGCDLNKDEGWDDAMRGVAFVHHIASPVLNHAPKDEEEIIGPARDGTLRVLRAAERSGVARVVQTSSTAAITYGTARPNRDYTEEDWTNPAHPDNSAYTRSKAIAERAAWDALRRGKSQLEWVAINPSVVLGKVFDKDTSPSLDVILKLLNRDFPGIPKMGWGMVDVRDVAELHVKAMLHPKAAGERFIVSENFYWLEDVARILREGEPMLAKRVPSMRLPSFAVKIAARFDPVVRAQQFELDRARVALAMKARDTFGWSPRPVRDAILQSARSLAEVGALR
jgi:dihydroflavonol-4-reductase